VADDAHEERFQQHEAMLRSFAAMLAAQHEMNRDVKVLLQHQAEFNQDIKTTLARIETLLARLLRPADNGRDA